MNVRTWECTYKNRLDINVCVWQIARHLYSVVLFVLGQSAECLKMT